MSLPSPDCPVCLGEGGWIDCVAEQSVLCYLCHPDHYQAAAPKVRTDQRWIDMPKLPCRYFGPLRPTPPWLLVIHSGAGPGNIARFFATTGYVVRKRDGKQIKVSAHVSYDKSRGAYTQGIPLDRVGWHCGGSRIYVERLRRVWPDCPVKDEQMGKLNFCSFGIEMQGPAGRRFQSRDHDGVVGVAKELVARYPSLKIATTHMVIDPLRKRDPGKQLDLSCFRDAGLIPYR